MPVSIWDDNKEFLLKKLHAQGLSSYAIAKEFKCSRNAVVVKTKRLGLIRVIAEKTKTPKAPKVNAKKISWTNEQFEELKAMLEAKLTVAQISDITGRPKNNIWGKISYECLNYLASSNVSKTMPEHNRGYMHAEKLQENIVSVVNKIKMLNERNLRSELRKIACFDFSDNQYIYCLKEAVQSGEIRQSECKKFLYAV